MWIKLKQHFQKAQQSLKKLQSLGVRQFRFNQANILVEQLWEQIMAQRQGYWSF